MCLEKDQNYMVQTEDLIHQRMQRQLEHNANTNYDKIVDRNELVVGVIRYCYCCSPLCRLHGHCVCNLS